MNTISGLQGCPFFTPPHIDNKTRGHLDNWSGRAVYCVSGSVSRLWLATVSPIT